jgi:3-oxoadipyl-CoA thiolase
MPASAIERMTMSEAFLVDGVRTPVGRYGGALSGIRPDDLAALVVAETAARAGLPSDAIDEVILGAANQAGEDNRNVARMAVLLAGLPDEIPGLTVNRLCASGMSAIALAAQAIRAGDADAVIAGGVESMTRAPWVQAKPDRAWAGPGVSVDTSIGWRFTNPRLAAREKATLSMPETAEEVARIDGISRSDADAFALESHRRALAAIDAGRFAAEIVAVDTPRGVVDTDEGPRRDTSLDVLAGLRPVVSGGSIVTAGNSSSLNDGASAVVVASAGAIERHGLRPRARILASATAALAPEIMGLGPVPATEKALRKAGLTVADLGAVELNEAFASQSLACIRRLGLDPAIVNADGGAIALGHPLGSSGSRLIVTLLGRMEREDVRYGLATMCVGVGQGTAMIVERVR